MSSASSIENTNNSARKTFERQQAAYRIEPYPTLKARIDRIDRLITLLIEEQITLCEAIQSDFGRRSIDIMGARVLSVSVTQKQFTVNRELI